MKNGTTTPLQIPEASTKDVLTEILRDGAREMLGKAIEADVADYIAVHSHERDAHGHRLVVCNGHSPDRDVQTGLGAIAVRQPRVNDKRTDEDGHRIRFTSHILPPYLRKTKSIEELIPWLYLRGISTGDFSQALAALLGPEAPGLSASTVVRLKRVWQEDHESWSKCPSPISAMCIGGSMASTSTSVSQKTASAPWSSWVPRNQARRS